MSARRRRRVAAGAGVGLVAALGVGGTAHADVDVVTVTSSDDPGDGDCSTNGCTLREAIAVTEDADAGADLDRILFAASVSGTITLGGTQLPNITEPLRIQGPGASALTIDANDSSRIFNIDTAPGDLVTISGLTLEDGAVPADGGAIQKVDARLTIVESVLTSNEVAGLSDGGAISSVAGGLRINATTLSGNTATDDGGAVVSVSESLSFVNSSASGNSADGEAGALYAFDTDTTITDSTLTGNTAAASGGGVYVHTNSTPSDLRIESSTLSGNHANGGPGGGALVDDGALEAIDSTVSGNTTDSSGGGLEADNGTLLLRRSTVSGNTSDNAGGGVIGFVSTIERSTISGNSSMEFTGYGAGLRANYAEISGSTFSGNTAAGPGTRGGGMAVQETLVLDASTVSGNSAPDPAADGGGIFVFPGASAVLTSSIVADNSAGDQGPDLFGDPFQVEFSLIEDGSDATINETAPISNLVGLDAELRPLADNGGPTMTHLPARGSPAVDFGVAIGTETDQRGFARTVDLGGGFPNSFGPGGDGTDMGAVELTRAEAAPPAFCNGKRATIVQTSGRRLNGTAGRDVIVGNNAINIIRSGGGNDIVCGLGGNDRLFGGPGRDRLFGGFGKDRLFGGPGKDLLRGGPGKDRLRQ